MPNPTLRTMTAEEWKAANDTYAYLVPTLRREVEAQAAENARLTEALEKWKRRELLESIAEFHPAEYMREEMDARNWTIQDVAVRVVVDLAKTQEIQIEMLSLRLLFAVGPIDPHLRMSADDAKNYGRVFGTSADMWLNLQTAWLEKVKALNLPPEPLPVPSPGAQEQE